ncbi:MAG: hypothetical protein ACRD2L_05115 [Terriglobia bacterium]
MRSRCIHSCRGLCTALEVAEHHEAEMIREYRQYLDSCDYPEVRDILGELIRSREKELQLLREKREILRVKFDTLDSVNESFS